MDIRERQFSAADVQKAAQVAPATLQNWLKRGVVVGQRAEDIGGGGVQGSHRRFSFYAVMQISIAQALLNVGMSDLKAAFKAAMHFAHSGYAPTGYAGRDRSEDEYREVGMPFHFASGRTLLATNGGHTTVLLEAAGQDILAVIRRRILLPNGSDGFVLLDAGAVFDRVCGSLGEHPNVVMDQSYGRSS